MIVLGVILLILGLIFGISILTYIGVVLLVIGAVFWILGSVGRRRRRPESLVLTPSGRRPAEDSAATVIALKYARRELASAVLAVPGLTLCGVEFSSPNVACAISRASASPSASSSWRSTSTQISTYCRCALRT